MCFLYWPLPHSKLNIILFTNYIVIHYRQCGGEGRGYVSIFVLYYCRISMEIECSLKWDEIYCLLQNDIPFSLNESLNHMPIERNVIFAIYICCNVMFPIQWSLFSMKSVGTFYRKRWQYCLLVWSWEQLLSYCLHV